MKALLIKQYGKISPKQTYTDCAIVDWIMFELKGATRKGIVVPGTSLKSDQLLIRHSDLNSMRDSDEFFSRPVLESGTSSSRPLILKSRLQVLSDVINIPDENSDLDCYWFTEDSIFERAAKEDVIHELKSTHMLYGDILIAQCGTHHGGYQCGMYWHYGLHDTLDHWIPILCENGYHGQHVYETR